MRALLLTVGSQGDIQPFIALATRLRMDGHEAVLAAPYAFEAAAAAHDVPFVSLDLDMTQVAGAIADVHGPRHFVRFATAMGSQAGGALPGLASAVSRGEKPDVVVHHPVLPLGQHLAEWLDVPAVVAPPLPALLPTRRFPSPVWSVNATLPGIANRASYRLSSALTGLRCRREIDQWRETELGLPRRPGRHDPLRGPAGERVPVLHSFSRHVLEPPPDWPQPAHVTGYWFLPTSSSWTPPRRLAAFLEAGEPPVYIGFGSMPVSDPRRAGAMVQDAVERAGVRAVVAGGYHGLRGITSSERIHFLRQAPHDWLFPRMRAIVHHGGAGTTGAAVASGRPQVICPVGVDQPFWACQMRERGVAPEAPKLRDLSVDSLELSLRQVIEDRSYETRAERLGRLVRAEDGTGNAVAALRRVAAGAWAVMAAG